MCVEQFLGISSFIVGGLTVIVAILVGFQVFNYFTFEKRIEHKIKTLEANLRNEISEAVNRAVVLNDISIDIASAEKNNILGNKNGALKDYANAFIKSENLLSSEDLKRTNSSINKFAGFIATNKWYHRSSLIDFCDEKCLSALENISKRNKNINLPGIIKFVKSIITGEEDRKPDPETNQERIRNKRDAVVTILQNRKYEKKDLTEDYLISIVDKWEKTFDEINVSLCKMLLQKE
jgi:hypothetical protein